MFQFDWASPAHWSEEAANPTANPSALRESVRGAMFLQWQEHCIECAVPHCYSTCNLYVQRRDLKCARLVYGIVRNPGFAGLLNVGADLRFRRWGKIEAVLTGNFGSLAAIRVFDSVDRVATAIVNAIGNALARLNPERRINGAFVYYRDRLIERIGRKGASFDGFVIECYSFERHPFGMIIELRKEGITIYREGVELRPGHNQINLNIPLPRKIRPRDGYLLMVYPDADKEVRVVFSWLDFIALRPDARLPAKSKTPATAATVVESPAAKVKCVAWDLDNTLWKGTLIEDGANALITRPEAERLIRALDERGIIQTVVSKNNHEEAIVVLERLGLKEYFLYPAINWGSKSENLQQIASRLNIHIDSFAVIDDSPFERQEIATALPMVRVFAEQNLESLLQSAEFDVPITETSRMRRASYRTEISREAVREQFGPDYLSYLSSCQLKLRIFRPESKAEIERCLELIQRSNQLNLSARRYSREEFCSLLANTGVLCVGFDCTDRFGSYGIVGFASIRLNRQEPAVQDFVLSCRVAQKHVEHAFYGWLAERMHQQSARRLLVDLVLTERNAPLVKVFEELPFRRENTGENRVLLVLDLAVKPDRDAVVSVDDSAISYQETR
jgi:FkbH-like protein